MAPIEKPDLNQDELSAKNFSLALCQASLFTPDEEISTAKITKSLLPKWLERFDADPMLLPYEHGMPRELPRIILKSKTDAWRCDIASLRINLIWQQPRIAVPAPTLEGFYFEAVKFLTEYASLLECRVGRIAAIIHRYACHDNPGRLLASHFCRDRWLDKPLNRPENFELHSHKKFSLRGQFEVNSWIRNKTGSLSQREERSPIVLVEQDLNTLSEEADKRSFGEQEIRNFFAFAAAEFETILKIYYPKE
jgi:hypothetical protein